MKVVINKCFGGFGVSDKAFERYLDLKGIAWYKSKNPSFGTHFYYTVPEEEYERIKEECGESSEYQDYSKLNELCLSYYDIERTDPILIQVIEEMGDDSFGEYSRLSIVEIPDDVKWEIDEYDGNESIREVSRVWR